jgi:hypothetical protein
MEKGTIHVLFEIQDRFVSATKFSGITRSTFNIYLSHLGIILASFLLISGIALLLIAFVKNKSYVENLKKGMNPYQCMNMLLQVQ